MKKNNFKYILVVSILFSLTSCKKFLNEELITAQSTDDFKTTTGIDQLVTGMYAGIKFHFNYTWAYTTTNYGTDEFTVGGDRSEQMWNSYDGTLMPLNGDNQSVWDNMYGNINSANIVIKNVPEFYTDGTNKNTRLGEGYFVRAFDYFKLVKQFGDVPLKLEPSETVELEYTRNTAQEVYQQIIDDFTKAYELLPSTVSQTGRLTKWAAAHFLAKTYLYRASEINDSWNSTSKQSDLQQAASYADIVINSGVHTLATNYSDLWNFTTVDGPNETNKEIIFAAQFSNNTATQGRYGNQVHLYYPSIYQNLPGMQRDIPGGREFQRMKTTDYAIEVFDRINDSRFWKSFKTAYLCNRPNSAPVWDATNAPSSDLVGKVKFVGGDTSILYIINNNGDSRYTAASIAKRKPTMFIRYYSGNAYNLLGNHGNYTVSNYPGLSKFNDGSRISVASQFGQRDGILARLGETYLIAAEAYGRLGDYSKAITYINALRTRAAYKSGENRKAYVDGGIAYKNNAVANTAAYVSYADFNTYYESNNIATTTESTVDQLRINSLDDILNSTHEFYNALNVSSTIDKFLTFILNERSRELMGELMRWEDLARTQTLTKRATTFNLEAKPIIPKDLLRPIPQTFLDQIRMNGQALTAEQKQAMQNPGW